MRSYVPFTLMSFVQLDTNRASLPYVWAENADEQFAAVDPDLDTEHYLYIPDRYTQLGWQAGEVEPEQWQNFLQQISDLKVKECIQYGLFNWFDDSAYLSGAVCFYDGTLYMSTVDSNLGNTPSSDSSFWTVLYTLSGTEYEQSLSELIDEVSTHINSTGNANPHKDDAETIGGYTQAEIDNMFSADNPDTMAHHIADMNNPHEETYLQIGALPVAGGTFTGVVSFSAGIKSGNWFIGWI